MVGKSAHDSHQEQKWFSCAANSLYFYFDWFLLLLVYILIVSFQNTANHPLLFHSRIVHYFTRTIILLVQSFYSFNHFSRTIIICSSLALMMNKNYFKRHSDNSLVSSFNTTLRSAISLCLQHLHHQHTDESFVVHKINVIINCFIATNMDPPLQVDIPQDQAERITEKKRELGPYMFREAQVFSLQLISTIL